MIYILSVNLNTKVMYKYKIVLNGQGGYVFCALLDVQIINFWIKNKSIELLQEYVLAHYLNDEDIDEEWRIPSNYRFNIFNNINSICLWETDSIELSNATICDIYELEEDTTNSFTFIKESDFNEQKLIDSFICTHQMIFKNHNNWKELILNGLNIKMLREGYLLYFKANARGYATHDEILTLNNEINKQNLKFFTGTFGSNDFSCNIIKKALYNPNTANEVVLYDFQMLRDAREKPDFDFTGLQKVSIENNNLVMKWIK